MKASVHREVGSAVISKLSAASWALMQYVNSKVPAGTLPIPNWAPGRLLKSYERSMPVLGLPRKTTSLCPKCNQQAMSEVLRGERALSDFANDPGLIEAEILEEVGGVLRRK